MLKAAGTANVMAAAGVIAGTIAEFALRMIVDELETPPTDAIQAATQLLIGSAVVTLMAGPMEPAMRYAAHGGVIVALPLFFLLASPRLRGTMSRAGRQFKDLANGVFTKRIALPVEDADDVEAEAVPGPPDIAHEQTAPPLPSMAARLEDAKGTANRIAAAVAAVMGVVASGAASRHDAIGMLEDLLPPMEPADAVPSPDALGSHLYRVVEYARAHQAENPQFELIVGAADASQFADVDTEDPEAQPPLAVVGHYLFGAHVDSQTVKDAIKAAMEILMYENVRQRLGMGADASREEIKAAWDEKEAQHAAEEAQRAREWAAAEAEEARRAQNIAQGLAAARGVEASTVATRGPGAAWPAGRRGATARPYVPADHIPIGGRHYINGVAQ